VEPDQFHLLFVCTANICRSPIAAELTRRRIQAAVRPDARQVTVSSAGTHGHDGAAMDQRAGAALRSLGAHPAGFAARTLTASLAAADLVLTAQRMHRAAVVALRPRSHGSVFTILEFARLVREVDADRLPADGVVPRARALVRAAAGRRGLFPVAADDDDIADPYGKPLEDYLACAKVIELALDRPLDVILDGPTAPATRSLTT
jgi:protein-tyrosine phosphatase